jgi:hypothetical protein
MVCASLLLAGCTASAPPGPSPKPSSATRTPSPTPSPTATKASDVLFTVSANVRGTDRSTIGIELTAHTPVAYDVASVLAMMKSFLESCATSADGSDLTDASLAQSGSTLMQVDLTSNRPGHTFAAPIELALGSTNFPRTVTGASVIAPPDSSGCYGSYFWGTSDPARGIADFQSADSTPDPTQWRYGRYGFLVAPASGTTIEACQVEITPLGTEAGLAEVGGWDPSTAATGTACMIGYTGE